MLLVEQGAIYKKLPELFLTDYSLIIRAYFFPVDVAYSSLASKFTVRRMYESAREEFEKVELLREVSIRILKVT